MLALARERSSTTAGPRGASRTMTYSQIFTPQLQITGLPARTNTNQKLVTLHAVHQQFVSNKVFLQSAAEFNAVRHPAPNVANGRLLGMLLATHRLPLSPGFYRRTWRAITLHNTIIDDRQASHKGKLLCARHFLTLLVFLVSSSPRTAAHSRHGYHDHLT